jgi:hypothetical protein
MGKNHLTVLYLSGYKSILKIATENYEKSLAMGPLKKVSFLQNMWEVLFENNMEVFFPRSIVLCWFFPNHIKFLHRKSSQEYQKSYSGFRVLHCLRLFLLNVANLGGFLPDSSKVTIIRRFKGTQV